MQIVSVCYREEKTHNREIAVQLVSVCYREKIAISERLLSRAKLQIVSVCCREKMQIRSNQSLVELTAKTNRSK